MNTPESVLKELGDYQAWLKRNPGIDLFDYATLAVSADAFIAVLEVLEPGLIEHNGAYFRARDFTVSAYDAWAAKLSDVVAIQRVMNHIHVSQFFREQEVPYCVLEVIASQIAKHWNQSFADRGLMAAYYGDGTDVEVTFFGVSSDRSPRPHGHGMV